MKERRARKADGQSPADQLADVEQQIIAHKRMMKRGKKAALRLDGLRARAKKLRDILESNIRA